MTVLQRVLAVSVTAVLGLAGCGQKPQEATSRVDSVDRDGYGWYHVSLRSTNGTTIKLDYQVQSYGRGGYIARPLWVSVESSGLSPSSQARAVIMGQGTVNVTQDLARVGDGKFASSINADLYVGFSGSSSVAYQIAVVVDGEWLKDPVSGNSNFSFELAQ